MAKKKSTRSMTRKKLRQEPIEVYNQNITEENMAGYTERATVRFGVNVVVQRSTPRLNDGLIPSVRRTIYAMFKLGALPDSDKKKLTNIIGATLEYHPHGDMSLTSTIAGVTVAYDNIQALVDGQGNFGSITGDSHAAARYLEGRLSQYAYDCFFKDYDGAIIDTSKNYTRKVEEPDYLPARYPHFLLSGVMGIGWGYSTYIPSFNLIEAFSMVQALIKDPTIPTEKVILFPDDPRGYTIIDRGDMAQICTTGEGAIKMRANMEYDEDENSIFITTFPKQVQTDKIIRDIYNLRKDGLLNGVKDVNEHVDKSNVELEIILKRDADVNHIMQTLYSKTALESSIPVRINFANPPYIRSSMSLKDAILDWIEYRIDLKQKELAKKLRYAKERIHLLEILTYILNDDNYSKSSKIFMESEDKEEASLRLVETYGITSLQANQVATMRLDQLTKKSRNNYAKQLETVREDATYYETTIRSKETIKQAIIEELDEAIAKYGQPRACKILKANKMPTYDSKYSAVITTNHIKKMTYGVTSSGAIAQGDEIVGYFPEVLPQTRINIIDSYGTLYTTTFDRVTPCSPASKGFNIKDALNIAGDVVRIFITEKDKSYDDLYLVMFTKQGIIKKSPLKQYTSARSGIMGIILNDNDKVTYCTLSSDEDSAMLYYTNMGFGSIIDLSEIKSTDRLSKGTSYLAFEQDGEFIVGSTRADTKNLVVITNKGFGKTSNLSDLKLMVKPRTPMTRLITLGESDTINVIQAINDEDHKVVDVTMQSGKVISVDANSIEYGTRINRGKKIVPVPKGDSIVKIKLRG